MTAATQNRNLEERNGFTRGFPVEASTKIYAGTMACVNASGNLTKGATSTTLQCVGVVKTQYDNSSGAAGAITGEAHTGVFGPFANSTSTDAIADKDVNSNCYMVDDQTVALTNGTNTRSVAGRIFKVTSEGVWVKFY